MNLEDRKKIAVGTPVILREDNNELTFTRTRSEPWQLGEAHGHTAGPWLVKVEGKVGGYSLARITPNAPLIELREQLDIAQKLLYEIWDTREIPDHEEGCPADDTCDCAAIARYNKALKGMKS